MGIIYDKNGVIGINLQSGSFAAITKSDSTTYPPSNLFIGTAGDIVVANLTGGTALFKNIPNGSFLPVQITKVLSTGTTASDFVILQ